MGDYPKMIYKRHTFLSALAMGLSAVIIAFIVSCTVVIVYGMNFAGDKSEELVSLAEQAIRGLPELQKSLPPVLADILDDRRQPDYSAHLDITADTTLMPNQNGRLRTKIEIVNNGSEVVSLLSLRIVVLNGQNEILTESNQWAATPIAADDDWRGPLMPGSRRYFATYRGGCSIFYADQLKTEVEITDIRVWNGEKQSQQIEGSVSAKIL